MSSTPVFSFANAKAAVDRASVAIAVPLRHADGSTLFTRVAGKAETEPAVAQVVGRMSSNYRRVEEAQADRMLRRRATSLTAEQISENELERVAACVVGWNLTDDGKAIECTTANVMQVLRAAPWIKEEISAAINDAARFLD